MHKRIHAYVYSLNTDALPIFIHIIQFSCFSQFGFYNKNETVVDMRDRLEYRNDLFGLKSLDKDGKIVRITVPGVKHLQWHRNNTVIDNHILPYLD